LEARIDELIIIHLSERRSVPPQAGVSACTRESWGLSVRVGPLQYGQTHSIVVPMKIPAMASAAGRAAVAATARAAGVAPQPYLSATLICHSSDGRNEVRVGVEGRGLTVHPSATLAAMRCDLVATGHSALSLAEAEQLAEAQLMIRSLVDRLATVAAEHVLPDDASAVAMTELYHDAEGRFSKAVSKGCS
jgi:hypothetical protein